MAKPQSNWEWALYYAGLGWRVFPVAYMRKDGTCSCGAAACKRKGKHPIPRNGLNAGTTDVTQIKVWWTENAHYNIGLATGDNGLFVLDTDDFGISACKETKGQPKAGGRRLKELTDANGAFPMTLMAKTGSGGTHYYFRAPEGVSVANSQDLVAPDIDIRGVGGYVILPPSNHYTGGKYEWLNLGAEIQAAPDWLITKLTTKKVRQLDELQPEVVEDSKKKDAKPLSQAELVRLLDFIPPDCDRETWIKVGAGLWKEFGAKKGWEIWKAWGQKYDDPKRGWTDSEGRKQWESFRDKGITGGTIAHLAKENGFRGFDVEAADAPELKRKWTFVVGIKRFVETERLLELDSEQFDKQFAPMFKGAASTHVLKNAEFPRVDAPTYWPKQPLNLTEGGLSKLNYWRDPGIVAKAGTVEPFLNHVNYLFPNPSESSILLDYLAYQVQQPGEKVHWAILLQGPPGVGKSYLAEVMERCLGASNVGRLPNETLHENFTGWVRNKQLIVVEELMAGKRLELMNRLKPMITEPWVQIREMYKPPYQQPNRLNFLFLTNHPDAIMIDEHDRRYCILATESPVPSDTKKYFKPLFEWTQENGPALLAYFAARDLSDFNPKSHAPMTEGKRTLIEESMPSLDHFIFEGVRDRQFPFVGDLIAPAELSEVLGSFNLRHNPKEIGRAMKRLHHLQLNKTRLDKGEYGVSLWAVRDYESYARLNSDQIRECWRVQSAGGVVPTPGVSREDLRHSNSLRDTKPESAAKKNAPM